MKSFKKSSFNKYSSNTYLLSPYFVIDIVLSYVRYIKKQGQECWEKFLAQVNTFLDVK